MIAQQPIIVNDVGGIGLKTVINSILIFLVVAIVVSLLFRYGRKTFQTIYREPGTCEPDDYYEYKDPNIHADC